MALETGDLLSEIIAAEEDNPVDILDRKQLNSKENRLRLAHLRRSSRNRSLSTRWDTKAIDQLPDYMKICYLALHNFVSEMAYDALKEQGASIIPHLSKVWADLCRAYIQEAKWYYSGYTPTLEEYINIAWSSVGGPQILVNTYFCISNPIKKEATELLDKCHDIIRYSSTILRLEDDLGTSSEELKRGDVPKSIQCYMKETGASEEDAREHIRFLITEKFKELNKNISITENSFSQPFIVRDDPPRKF